MESPETFQQVPLSIDPTTKAISSSDASLASEIEELNKLHRALISLDAPNQVPPPPAPVNMRRNAQVAKLRESGNTSYKKGAFAEAMKMYDFAIQMANGRANWEASGWVREETSALYNNRAQIFMSQSQWVEAANDAEISVEMKKIGNVKGWWRHGQCLKEMGRLEEASEWVRNGLEFERAGPDKEGVKELEALERDLEKVAT